MRAYADSSFIMLHVAAALTLESELFLTSDARQAQLAKGEGLKLIDTAKAPEK